MFQLYCGVMSPWGRSQSVIDPESAVMNQQTICNSQLMGFEGGNQMIPGIDVKAKATLKSCSIRNKLVIGEAHMG